VPNDAPVVYDSGDYHAVFQRCLAEIGWAEKAALQGCLIDGRYHGLGLCCSVESGGSGKENARITITADGAILVAIGGSGVGQGIETTFAQIAADALGVPVERIRVLHSSTSRLREGFGSFHGRTMIMGGSAVVRAAENLIEALRAAAAARFGCEPSDVQVEDGTLRGPDGRKAEFASFATDATPFQADGAFNSPERAYSYGTHAAHVAVDPQSGVVEVLDYVAVDDVGRMINPVIVHGQKLGAIVQGLGGVMLEQLVYDEDGQLLTGSFMDYAMPRAAHFPNVRAISLEIAPSPNNPLGVKGAGEDGIIPVGATIANAVAAALRPLGCEPVSLPLSPARVWQMIHARPPARAAAAD
jgi:carbon-monoxide dehydrogenase large subunit